MDRQLAGQLRSSPLWGDWNIAVTLTDHIETVFVNARHVRRPWLISVFTPTSRSSRPARFNISSDPHKSKTSAKPIIALAMVRFPCPTDVAGLQHSDTQNCVNGTVHVCGCQACGVRHRDGIVFACHPSPYPKQLTRCYKGFHELALGLPYIFAYRGYSPTKNGCSDGAILVLCSNSTMRSLVLLWMCWGSSNASRRCGPTNRLRVLHPTLSG